MTLTATVTLHRNEYPIARLFLRNANAGEWDRYDSIAIGWHSRTSTPEDDLSLSWARRTSDGDWSTIAKWLWEEISAIDYDKSFAIRFAYNNGWVGLSINGETVWVEDGLPYGSDVLISLSCDDWDKGGTVTFTNITIEGFSLE